MERICLFGGSFDPVHKGHLHIAQRAIEEADLDRLIFVPCAQSPHKSSRPGATPAQRLEMLRIACADLPKTSVDHLELARSGASYSWQTVEHYRHTRPDARLYWLVGTDQWQALPRWARADYLGDNLQFIVFRRGAEKLAAHEGFAPPLVIAGNHPASSTAIRQQIADSRDPQWLPAAVGDYIEEQALYR